MATIGIMRRLAALLLLIPAAYAAPADAGEAAGTAVHVAVFRLDYLTLHLKTAYEFPQTYRKSLAKPGYNRVENLYVYTRAPGDFGFTKMDCRLTGEQVLYAETIWNGSGRFLYPTAREEVGEVRLGFTSPDPDTLVELYTAAPAGVWNLVRGTDVIHRLSSHGAYEVYVKQHYYRVGVQDPTTAEWIVVAFTRPPAPLDVGLVDVLWPRTLVTAGVRVTPAVELYNFSDASTDVALRLTLEAGGSEVYRSERTVAAMPPDEGRAVEFDDVTRESNEPLELRVTLIAPGGAVWDDEWADNDAGQRGIGVTDQPVFRYDASVPRDGRPEDFDGDGDTDVVGLRQNLTLWQNDGAGHFTDVTHSSQIAHRSHPRAAISGEFTGDGVRDMVVAYWDAPLQFLRGVSPGVFVEHSDESGLSSYTAAVWIEAADIDLDGDLDLLSTKGGEAVFANDGSGHFTNVTGASGIGIDGYHIDVGDIDGDGAPDLALGSWGGRPGVFRNDGGGRFVPVAGPWGPGYWRELFFLDVDRDDDLDLFFLQWDRFGPPALFRNDGNLVFADASGEVAGFPGDYTAAAGDFNADGYDDIVSSGGQLFINDAGTFVDTTALLIDVSPGYYSFGSVYFADMNADGNVDVYGENGAYISQGMVREDEPPPPSDEQMAACLDQNVPNPFNPLTKIHYVIERRTRVTLRVYNVAGQLVQTIVDRKQSPRPDGYTVFWNGTNANGIDVASGVYFYRLRTNHFTQTRKMALIR